MENQKNIKSHGKIRILPDMDVQLRISHEKFASVPSVEMVLENHKFYPNLPSKYSLRYDGFRNFQ